MFGGRAVSDAIVTKILVALNVIAYIAEIVYPKMVGYGQMVGAGVRPGAAAARVGVADGDWYRLITNAFLHEPLGSGIGLPTSPSTCGR